MHCFASIVRRKLITIPQGPPPRKHRKGSSPSPLHREDCSPSPVNTNPTFHCGLEVKTITNKRLKRKFDLVEQLCGRFSHCDFGDNNFKLLVWDPKYRTQLLHHATVVDLDYVLFVVANESTIRYATLVYIPEVKRNTYREILVGVFQRSLKWAHFPFGNDPLSRIPRFRESAVSSASYPVDKVSLCYNIIVWQKLILMVRLTSLFRLPNCNQHKCIVRLSAQALLFLRQDIFYQALPKSGIISRAAQMRVQLL